VDIIINSNSPITSGSSQNQCLSGQSANLVSDTTFRAYLVDNSISTYDHSLKTAGTSPAILPNSVMYGTGANGYYSDCLDQLILEKL
jgi:trimeric autotransporter adhesin